MSRGSSDPKWEIDGLGIMRCGLMEAQGDRTGAGTRWGSRVCCGRVSPQWRQYCCTRSSPFGDLRPTGYRPVLFCMFPESVKSSHYSASLHGGLVRPAQNAGLGARGRARQFRLGDEPLRLPAMPAHRPAVRSSWAASRRCASSARRLRAAFLQCARSRDRCDRRGQ